ncbi:MAG: helix-hairpin-helix domain-containing protein [bacterium]
MVVDNRVYRGDTDKANSDSKTLEKALANIQLIESLLGEDEKRTVPENTVRLPLGRVMALLPDEFKQADGNVSMPEKTIDFVVDDLFARLAKGRVTVSVAQLVFSVPADLVVPAAYDATGTEIVLPLPDIVAAIDPKLMEQHTSQSYRRYNLAAMADPFASPKPKVVEETAMPAEFAPVVDKAADLPLPDPVVEEAVPGAPTLEIAETVAAVVVPAVEAVEPAQEVAEVPVVEDVRHVVVPDDSVKPEESVGKTPGETVVVTSDPDWECEQTERLGGVNINTAMDEQLLTLEGVSAGMARNIVAYRTANGPFKSIFHLCRVPGLGRKTFKRITGMPWSDKHLHRKRKLATLLDISSKEVAHLPAVALALANKLNFAGCVISDRDGLVLAGSRAGDEGESFGAIVPRLIFQIRETVKAVQDGEIESVSLCFRNRMFTVAASGGIYLTCIHQSNKLTLGQLALFNKVAVELAWLLSYRGYVGHSS